jgi:hypothetical protein
MDFLKTVSILLRDRDMAVLTISLDNWAFKQGTAANFGPIQTSHCYSGQDEDTHRHFDEVPDPKELSESGLNAFIKFA